MLRSANTPKIIPTDEAEQQRRRALLKKMRALRGRVSKHNIDLSEAEADALADEVTDEAVASLVKRGVIRFKQE